MKPRNEQPPRLRTEAASKDCMDWGSGLKHSSRRSLLSDLLIAATENAHRSRSLAKTTNTLDQRGEPIAGQLLREMARLQMSNAVFAARVLELGEAVQ
jgi:hypothetical protein